MIFLTDILRLHHHHRRRLLLHHHLFRCGQCVPLGKTRKTRHHRAPMNTNINRANHHHHHHQNNNNNSRISTITMGVGNHHLCWNYLVPFSIENRFSHQKNSPSYKRKYRHPTIGKTYKQNVLLRLPKSDTA